MGACHISNPLGACLSSCHSGIQCVISTSTSSNIPQRGADFSYPPPYQLILYHRRGGHIHHTPNTLYYITVGGTSFIPPTPYTVLMGGGNPGHPSYHTTPHIISREGGEGGTSFILSPGPTVNLLEKTVQYTYRQYKENCTVHIPTI